MEPMSSGRFPIVIPAPFDKLRTGIQGRRLHCPFWMPAFAGMTRGGGSAGGEALPGGGEEELHAAGGAGGG
jgi:hypothetical protein